MLDGPKRLALAGSLVIGVLICGVVAEAVLRFVPAVATDVNRALAAPAQEFRGMWVEDGELRDAGAAGIGLGLLGVLLAGVPAGLTAIMLAARARRWNRPWPSAWGTVFQGGVVLQGCSLVLAAFILLLSVLFGGASIFVEGAPFAAFLTANVLVSAAALPAWRDLQRSVLPAAPSSITR